MTRINDAELNAYRAIAASEIRAHQGAMFRHEGVFTKDAFRWACRFSVRDVTKLKADEVAKLRMYADVAGLLYTDLRRLSVHPDDVVPFPGATIPFDDGVLEVLEWGQISDFTDLRVGTAVLRRP